VWAWFKDIHLAMPTQDDTSFLAPQADEYDKPSVVATSAANMVGHLRDAPVIGSYARATELALRGAAQIASAFGYSRPTITNDNGRMIIHPAGNLSNVNVVDTATKLAFDAKQEVTVDPTVTGYGNGDCMDIAEIASKRMLINQYDWTFANPTEFQQFIMNITPMQAKPANIPNQVNSFPYLISPSCHMAAPFKYWRGSMEITIEVVASTFHKGKLRVVYDPLGVMTNGASAWSDEYNLNYSSIIDIAQSRTFTMKIGWGNARSYCLTGPIEANNSMNFNTFATPLAANTHNAYANGRLGIHVLTPLTSVAGVNTNPVSINIYANMCDDFQIAVPKVDDFRNYSTNGLRAFEGFEDFQYQSGELEQVPGPMVAEDTGLAVDLNGTMEDSQLWESKFNMVHIGEEMKSIRQIIKRYCPSTFIPFRVPFDKAGTAATNKFSFQVHLPNFPSYGGWSYVNSLDPNVDLLIEAYSRSYVPVPFTNWLTWYGPAFLMRRGAIRNKYLIEGGNGADYQIECMAIINSPVGSGLNVTAGSNLVYTATADTTLAYKGRNYPTTSTGAFMNYPAISNVIDGECPFQSDRSWYLAQNRNLEDIYSPWFLNNEPGHKLFITGAVQQPQTSGGMRRYTAAGEDFSFIHYKYPPLVIRATDV
jgi:hypothetical protein